MRVVEEFIRECRSSVLRLKRQPGFAFAAVGTLALGLGASVAIFTIVNAVLLRPLPYEAPERLMVIESTREGDALSLSWPDLQDYTTQTHAFEDVAGFAGWSGTLTGTAGAERVRAQMVSANLFDVLGVAPQTGRTFAAGEDAVGAEPLVVISDGLWRRSLGGRPDVVGQSIVVDNTSYTVIGVMPRAFDFPGGIVYGAAEMWTTFTVLDPSARADRDEHPGIVGIARMQAGTTTESARADLVRVAGIIATKTSPGDPVLGVRATSALDAVVGSARGYLILLFGAVVLVLLIACANVANLLLVHATGRRTEFAVRAALGGSSARLAAQVGVESLVLALLSGGAGMLLALLILTGAAPLLGAMPRADALSATPRVFLFALALTLLAAAAAGAAPMLQLRRAGFSGLRARSATGRRRARQGLAAAECALALVLTVGAALLVRSYIAMQNVPRGIDSTGVVTFEITAPSSAAGDEAATALLFHQQYMDRLEALPGVVAVGAITTLPFSGSGAQSGMRAEGSDAVEPLRSDFASVTPDYLEAIGMTLVRGRGFDESDRSGAELVALVDERFAERMWPGEDPVGRRIQGGGPGWRTVVGVVQHVRNYGVHAESREEVFVPFAQRVRERLHYTVRVDPRTAAMDMVGPARAALAELDPAVPLYRPRLMEDVIMERVATPRLNTAVLAGLGGVALLLSAVGIFSVMAYSVSMRKREIGLRLAVGATPANVRRLVVSESLGIAAVGVIVGTGLAAAGTRLISAQLFGIAALDAQSFAFGIAALLAVAALAGLVPARRAARISPLQSLRE